MSWYRVCAASADALFAEGAVAVEPDGAGFVGHFLRPELAAAAGAAKACEPPDWAADWLLQQRSARVSRRLFVTSSAAPQAAPPGTLPLVLDPGLAFGDGHHATTRLCLAALDDELAERPFLRVLDVGTGTGILAIAARLLGATRAAGSEIDPSALRSAARNAQRNGLSLELSLAIPSGPFDLALANIPEEAHEALCAAIARALAGGSTLLLAGFAPDRAARVAALYQACGLRQHSLKAQSGWALLQMAPDGESR